MSRADKGENARCRFGARVIELFMNGRYSRLLLRGDYLSGLSRLSAVFLLRVGRVTFFSRSWVFISLAVSL